MRVRFDAGMVSGRVDGTPGDAWVYLLPAKSNAFVDFRSAQVEADGSFRVDAPPGSRELIAAHSPNAYPPRRLLRDLAEGKHESGTGRGGTQ